MKEISVTEVARKSDLREFVEFPMELYAGCPYYVPPLLSDEYDTFSRKKNPAFDVSDAKLFLARDGSKAVGRIAALVNHLRNEKYNKKNLDFAWFDCVNDAQVASALFGAAEDWARTLGLTAIVGPEGFDILSTTGMLVEGFDHLATMANPYNYPYYADLVEQYGFTKEIDFVEFRLKNICTTPFPPRLASIAERAKRLGGYRVLEFRKKKEMLGRAPEVLKLVEDTYSQLYGSAPLTERQNAYYAKKFFPYLKKELVKVVVNKDDEVIGFFIAIPSVSEALQKARGRLFPFGFIHLLRATRNGNKVMDFCLGGVKEEYRGRGVDLVMAVAMHETATQLGFECAETNPELEDNMRVQSEWKYFDHVQHKRRRVYRKAIPVDRD